VGSSLYDAWALAKSTVVAFQSRSVGKEYDLLAPDGSEIRELVKVERGSMVHCRLLAGQVAQAVRHQTVEELWYCLAGAGEVWRRDGGQEEVTRLEPGVSVSIPCGTAFQIRATTTLELVIATMPPWPGPREAVALAGKWPTDDRAR
jgi:mannose-6-phosphate isomerase-like protein (cupin superfamily)